MRDPAAIEATFCGMRTIAGRKVTQITMEVPIEQTSAVLTALGPPNGVDPQWVAIALLDKKAVEAQSKAPEEPVHTKDKRRFEDLPPATQAGIRCGETGFWRFLEEQLGFAQHRIGDAETAADFLRRHLGIRSRADLNTDQVAVEGWYDLDAAYAVWLRT